MEPTQAKNDLAQKLFPKEWALNEATTGPRRGRIRARLRKRAVYETKMIELRAINASCATCKYFADYPSPGNKGKHICEAGSDFHGYQTAVATGLCPSYSAASGEKT